jgi:hypothetical protein
MSSAKVFVTRNVLAIPTLGVLSVYRRAVPRTCAVLYGCPVALDLVDDGAAVGIP